MMLRVVVVPGPDCTADAVLGGVNLQVKYLRGRTVEQGEFCESSWVSNLLADDSPVGRCGGIYIVLGAGSPRTMTCLRLLKE